VRGWDGFVPLRRSGGSGGQWPVHRHLSRIQQQQQQQQGTSPTLLVAMTATLAVPTQLQAPTRPEEEFVRTHPYPIVVTLTLLTPLSMPLLLPPQLVVVEMVAMVS
jgi:hypothetical protein